jgi:hypothetical protein
MVLPPNRLFKERKRHQRDPIRVRVNSDFTVADGPVRPDDQGNWFSSVPVSYIVAILRAGFPPDGWVRQIVVSDSLGIKSVPSEFPEIALCLDRVPWLVLYKSSCQAMSTTPQSLPPPRLRTSPT